MTILNLFYGLGVPNNNVSGIGQELSYLKDPLGKWMDFYDSVN